jgi:hypothetical protein
MRQKAAELGQIIQAENGIENALSVFEKLLYTNKQPLSPES